MFRVTVLAILLATPLLVSAQETYGNANAAKKVLVVRFDTPFKKAVFAEVGKLLSDNGYYVEVIAPSAFTAPAMGTLVVYGEGSTTGTPWDDKTRDYLAGQTKGVFFATFKRSAKPFKAPAGVDAISGSSKDNQATTAKKIADSVMKQL
ncbi:MAG: hypothetical protein ACRC0X_00430 [Brevinema sp.]